MSKQIKNLAPSQLLVRTLAPASAILFPERILLHRANHAMV
jgi:hypothetical protein